MPAIDLWGKMTKKPVMRARLQGNLDGLCGLYAIVNALRTVVGTRDLDEACERDLFRHLTSELVARTKPTRRDATALVEAICCGVDEDFVEALIGSSLGFLKAELNIVVRCETAFRKPTTELDLYWQKLVEHSRATQSSAILLLLGGHHDHWTCAYDVSDKRINFIDSDRLRFLNRASCTVSSVTQRRKHRLFAECTYLLQREV